MTGNEGNGRGRRSSEGLGPFDAVRTFTDVQRRGMEGASQVIGRFLDLIDGSGSRPGPSEPRAEAVDGAATGFAQLRASVARAVDLYAELVQRSFEGYADLVEQSLRARGVRLDAGDDGHEEALTIRGVAGGHALGTVWIHNATYDPAAASFRLTDLTAHDGAVVPAVAGTFSPDAVGDLAPGASTSARLAVLLASVAPGVYRGHVLATGLPESALPVKLVVAEGSGDRLP